MKIPIHTLLEEKFVIGKTTSKEELMKLVALLRQNPDQEVIFKEKKPSPPTSKKQEN